MTDCIHCGTPLPICLINHANHDHRCCELCKHRPVIKEIGVS